MKEVSEVEELARRVELVRKTLVVIIMKKLVVIIIMMEKLVMVMMMMTMTVGEGGGGGKNLWIEVASAEVVRPRKMRKGEPEILMIIVRIVIP